MFHWSAVPHGSWMGGRPTYWPHCGLHSFHALPELGVEEHPLQPAAPSRPILDQDFFAAIYSNPPPGDDHSTVFLLSLPECPEHMISDDGATNTSIDLRPWASFCQDHLCAYPCWNTALLTNCDKYRCLITEHRSASDQAGYSWKNRNLFPPLDLIFDLRRGVTAARFERYCKR